MDNAFYIDYLYKRELLWFLYVLLNKKATWHQDNLDRIMSKIQSRHMEDLINESFIDEKEENS